MRDIVLTLIFLGIVPYALRHTWIGVLLWTWFSLMNPHRMTYGFASGAPFALVAALIVLVSTVVDRRNLRLPADATVALLVMFVGWMCLTTFNAIDFERSANDLITTLKVQLMILITIMALRQRRQIEAFVWVVVCSVGFFGVKGGAFTIISGGSARVWGPQDSYLYENNALGLALTMIIPLMNYLRLVSPRPWVRRALMAAMLLCAASVLGSQSRGALLAIAAMTVVLWTRSQRKVVGGVVLVGLFAGLVAFMPASWEARMSTIGTYQEDGSAMSRINAWHTAVNIANDRVTGGGYAIKSPQVFQRYSPKPEWVFTAHSIYFQALGEQGWIGLLLFLGIGATAFWTSFRIRRKALERPETLWVYDLAGMVQVSMVGFAVGGSFLSLAYLDLAYNIMLVLIVCKCWMREERWKSEPIGLFGAGAPVGRLPRQPHPVSIAGGPRA